MTKSSNRKNQNSFLRGMFYCVMLCFCMLVFTGCGKIQESEPVSQEDEKSQSFESFGANQTIRILSGSENKELEEILNTCSQKTKVKIEITYKGSIDIMRELQSGAKDYDAVWPASSLWISMGDEEHLVKQAESISTTPVVFGIRKSLAEELGFVGKEVSVKDILSAIREGKMSFCMTSATQSNSGASAYMGFLYALLQKQEAMTKEDLQDAGLQKEITELLSGIDRSSGSSDWLKDMFLKGDYDAMVNYEALIISANQLLEQQGKETLYVVYPYDGLSIADSPLGYVDHGDDNKKNAFTKVQEYLLSKDTQAEIQRTGRRTGYSGVEEENKDVFCEEWGIDTQRILSPISMPSAEVLVDALNLYQAEFKKPSLNVYCLDFSGSMEGEGNEALMEAMEQLLIQSKARENFLQATKGEVNVVLTFSDKILNIYVAEGSDEQSLEKLYGNIAAQQCDGGTDIYLAAQTALHLMEENYDLSQYTPAIILMTDGKSNGSVTFQNFSDTYQELQSDIPVFSIMFGDAKEEELKQLAELSNAREFDGTENLVEAFRSVKGYN